MNPENSNENGNTISQSERGFSYGDTISDEYGSTVYASESSAATRQRIWLRTTGSETLHKENPNLENALHLSIEEASALRDQLDYLIKNHTLQL